MDTIIQTGIKLEHKEATARLYVIAFEGKFAKILGDQDEVINLFKRGINVNRGISAISETNELLGIAGFQMNGKSLVDISWKDFINQYGLFRGIYKFALIAILFDRKSDNSNQLLMDGVAVKEGNRGKGIGKKLFQGLEKYAQENGLQSIKLDVIDENPKAKKLYEKLGFVAAKYQKVPQMINKLIGVTGVTTMIKKL